MRISEIEDLEEYGGVKTSRGITRRNIPEVVSGRVNDVNLEYLDSKPEKALENYVLDKENDLFIVDDHNHALAGWVAALYSGKIVGDSLLVHVDYHADDSQPPDVLYPDGRWGEGIPGTQVPSQAPMNVDDLNSIVPNFEINEFIDPALRWGIFDEEVSWGLKQDDYSSDIYSVDTDVLSEYDSVVFDLDLDVFLGVDGERYKYDQSEINAFEEDLAELIRESDFTTIATSPGFIDQEKATRKARKLIEMSENKRVKKAAD